MNPLNEFSPRSTPTASKLLSTAETLALLERLRQGMGDAVHRTDELERDFSARSHKLRSQFEQARATERMRGAAEIAAAEADLAANRERVEASFAVRKARIARAGESAQKQRLAEIEGEESKHTLENQDGLFEAKHVYEADTQNNKTRHAAFANQLADEVAALDRIEARARTALAGYRFLARLITAPPSSPPSIRHYPRTNSWNNFARSAIWRGKPWPAATSSGCRSSSGSSGSGFVCL